ncbi:unnamed protein product [Amoebophrya sp. A25]|nr:unnamed protein product [Amoebophrya sp. A25]|eukprot:GSA25T00006384001.1
MGCDADKQEPVVRFLSVLNDLGNRSEIEIQAASELAADLSYLQDLEMEQLRKYLSDPTVFEVYSNILGHLDNSFWGPDGNPIDDSSDRIVSVRTGKLKKSLMGKSRLPADLDEIEGPQKAEKPPSDPEITASGAPESTAAAPGAVPEGAGTTTQGGSSSSSSSKKKKRVKDPVDLFERRQKYKERAKDLFRTPVTPYESRDQSCILALGSEKGEISLVRVTPERVAPRAKTTTTNGASAADSENNSLSAATAGMSNDDAFAYVFGGKSLKLHRETICTWQAHEPGQKITSLKLLPGVQALISCGDSCSVKIWPLDTYFGSDGRDPEDELNGVDHCWVQDQSVLDSVESYRHDTKKLILSDTVFYKKPWVNVVLGPDVTSKTLAWYMPRCLRKSLLFKYQAYRVLEKLRTQDLLGEEEGSLHVQTSIKLYDRYYGKLKAEQDLKNEYARREAEKLKEKSKGISLVEVKSYTVSSVKPLPEPDSLRPLTIFKEMTQTHEKPWVSNWQPMKHVLREQEQRKAQAAAAKDEKKGRRASVTNLQLGKKKKAKGKDPDADMFFPDRLNKASHEWNFERLYGKGGAGHPAGEKVLRRTYSDIKSGLSWRPEYDQFNTDRKRRVEEDNTQRRRRKPGQPDITSNHLPAEERMKILMETIAEPLVHEHRDPTSERMATRKWQSFVDKEKASLPQSSNIDWLRTTMPARFRTDKTQGAASPERHISSPEKTRFLTTLSDFSAVRRRVEGTKPSKDTRDKFKPEVNVGRDFAVSGGDVMLKGGEAARRRVSDMQQMLLRQYPRRPPEEEQMLMDLASKPGAILM